MKREVRGLSRPVRAAGRSGVIAETKPAGSGRVLSEFDRVDYPEYHYVLLAPSSLIKAVSYAKGALAAHRLVGKDSGPDCTDQLGYREQSIG
jgi:hypothetical protein